VFALRAQAAGADSREGGVRVAYTEAYKFYVATAVNFLGDRLDCMSDKEVAIWLARKNINVPYEDIELLVKMVRDEFATR
jgi:hypothetical protein